jgi:predicted nucleic acid-binding protein
VSIDLRAILRRHKPQKRRAQLSQRDRRELLDAASARVTVDAKLLPDTNIYIMEAAGELPPPVAELLERATLYHSTVCLAEITVGLANSDVTAATWPAEREYWSGLFDRLPKARTKAPDAEVWAAAGITAGTLTRLQGFQPHQRKDALNDALIYLTAMKLGVPVLTENRRDFDFLQQLVPGGRVYFV